MKVLDGLSRRISGASAFIGALCTVAMALAITTDVVIRAVTGSSLPGLLEISETLLVAMIFLGLSYAAYVGAHISMSLLTDSLPERVSSWVRVAAAALTTGILIWLLWATGVRFFDSFASGEYKFGLINWPLWPARLSITAGILFALPAYVLTMWVYALRGLGKNPQVGLGASQREVVS